MTKFKRLISIILTIAMLCTTMLSTGMIAHASMLPLEEVRGYLILSGYSNEELKKMPLDDILGMLEDSDGNAIEISDEATTLWQYIKDGEDGIEVYQPYTIGANETIDLSQPENITEFQLEFIVGKDGQLNAENVRYIITVHISDVYNEKIQFEVYAQYNDVGNVKVEPAQIDFAISDSPLSSSDNPNQKIPLWMYGYAVDEVINCDKSLLNMTSELSQYPGVSLEIYEYDEYLVNNQLGYELFQPVTNQLLNQDMTSLDAGYHFTNDINNFVVLYYRNGVQFDVIVVSILVAGGYVTYSGEMFTSENGTIETVSNSISHASDASSDVWKMECELKEGYAVDSKYNFSLDVIGAGQINQNFNDKAIKAVVGHYDSLDDAVDEQDIKDELLTDTGYTADYSGDGVDFTIFFPDGTFTDSNVKHLTIKAIEYQDTWREFTEKPIIGEADPWLRVIGATDSNGNDYDSYVIENGKNINMDTYYGYGYQTVFINDANADLSELKPTFWYANTDRVYAVSKDTGDRIDENHIRDFTEENQQYTGIIIDNNKENERNYWVTFKKLNNNGPELFVFGPNEREVILDEYFEFKHDILIANIGNAPLEDISVELLDAENVKLDEYWTVGGEGNDTLAAFTSTSSDTQYGELPNLAKIRLLPDGDGEVKGTLIIKAKGQDPVMITLNGTAQNPEIVTETLSDAVKYVPYQQIVATNNMHDWVETKFSVVDGALPEGITLNSETGEIYGVPTVPDSNSETTYSFTVEAKYLVDGEEGYFNPSYKDFKLVVKPNTDENVYLASDSDDGYSIKQPIGIQTGEYSFELNEIADTEFTSNGEYGEFVGLWLNGELLEPGVDYDSESGSTKITIKSQTFENRADMDGTNTIAMEFRKDTNGDGKGDSGAEMNRTAQNFTVNEKPTQEEIDKAAANQVISLIGSIPSTVTLDDRDIINEARTAYNALTSAQQALVTNYDRLTRAEAAIKQLEENAKDKAAADKVVNMIESLPSPITLDSKNAVNAARNAYNMLTASQKGYVTNYSKLLAAENRIVELEAEAAEQAEINAVIAAINAIPDDVTLEDKSIVTAARNAYNALDNSQKAKVINYDDLTNAEATIAALEAQENADKTDKAAADTVINLINTIPEEVTLEDKALVESVRKAYDALTNTQKALVANYSDLTDAEAKIHALEAYEEASENDKEAANKVIALIDAIPANVTLSNRDTVTAAREAYDALTDSQKAIVTNYEKLIEAEVKIAEIENDNYEKVQSVTFIGILVDKNGNACADMIVEIHSTIQTGRTDENGSFQFNGVEFGKHTIFIKDENGNIIAQKEFNILLGSPLAIQGSEIVAENGSVFTVKMQLDEDELTFLGIEEGNQAPIVDTNKDGSSIEIGDDGKIPNTGMTSPQTGEYANLPVWYALLIASLSVLVIMMSVNIKKKKTARKHQR